jgi:hypothetical protein
MSRAASVRSNTLRSFARFLLFALALFGQLGAGALAADMPDPAARALPFADLTVICHSGHSATDEAPAHRHCPDCALCPFCLSLTAPFAALLPAPARLPPPVLRLASAIRPLPPARAPPSFRARSFYPTGPPPPI